MNVYDKMLKQFQKEKVARKYTKEKDLEEILKTLSVCENIIDKYGIDLNSDLITRFNVYDVDKFNANIRIRGGEAYIGAVNEIYNSDKQPEKPTLLMKISHSTGAYIFGDYYPKDLFDEFFKELIEKIDPEYIDPTNHSIYCELKKAINSIVIYDEVYKKYVEKNKENYKKIMIEEKKREIERLQAELQ